MSRTAELLHLARQHTAATYTPPPLIAHKGAGAWLWDLEGQAYLDFAGGIGVNALGHAHPAVVAAICQQAQRLCHTSNGYYHAGAIDLCTRLSALWPGDAAVQTFLCNSGTEALEAALKLARRYFFDQGFARYKFVAMHQSFHGRTMGALSITGQTRYQKGFGPLVAGTTFVPFDDLESLAQHVTQDTAAVVLEPILGNGGVCVPSAGYLRGVREICNKMGALLIVDEVQTGLGRTGTWFACSHDGVVPDILCLAKALGGGLPLGAIMGPQPLMATLQPGVHGTTFGGNPVACAASLATLDVIARDNLLIAAQTLGASWRQELAALPHVCQVRGRGLLVGLMCQIPAKVVQTACLTQGLLVTCAGPEVIRMFPPLNVTQAELTMATQRLAAALSHLDRSPVAHRNFPL